MLELEAVIRRQIARDQDCSENAGKVLDMRAQMLALIGQRQALCAEGVPQPVIGKRRYEMTRIIRGQPKHQADVIRLTASEEWGQNLSLRDL